jgi:SAM-dependent methyltransferase
MQCPGCESTATTLHDVGTVAPFVAYRTGVASDLGRTCTCGSCGLRWCAVRWTDDQAAALYRGYRDADYDAERRSFEPGYSSGYLNAPREYLPDIEAWVREYLDPASVLDIGGNDGRNTPFTATADVTVWEIGQPEPSGTYDLVVLAHVLEHVAAPLALVRTARGYLNPGGLIYVEVPIEPVMDVWHEHVQQFDRLSLSALLHDVVGMQERMTSVGPVGMALAR